MGYESFVVFRRAETCPIPRWTPSPDPHYKMVASLLHQRAIEEHFHMTPEEIFGLTARLISIRSLAGEELQMCQALKAVFESYGWKPEVTMLGEGRANIQVIFGTPTVLFTTHVDIVEGAPELFLPRREGNRLFGRGSCDAKGIIATMIGAAHHLLQAGQRDFGLLFVAGEETDGIGARAAAKALRGRGVRYIVNGEPTEGKLMKAHKGSVSIRFTAEGRSAHSGYPERGDDANLRLCRAIDQISRLDLGSDPELGPATINFGVVRGGISANAVSAHAVADAVLRTVRPWEETKANLLPRVDPAIALAIDNVVEPVQLMTLDGFDLDVASYCSDIPNFDELRAKALLYGPGSIHVAHRPDESIGLDEVATALQVYQDIYRRLQAIERGR